MNSSANKFDNLDEMDTNKQPKSAPPGNYFQETR